VRLRCRAFTLIELLVVMAIMAVLCAMLFPVFAAGRSNGKRISCLSHFRQVSLATRMYSSDYDDLFMPINHEHIERPNLGPTGPSVRPQLHRFLLPVGHLGPSATRSDFR
jgi:prepilin-type N-terminal cleavage/methylation domain-containing protein